MADSLGSKYVEILPDFARFSSRMTSGLAANRTQLPPPDTSRFTATAVSGARRTATRVATLLGGAFAARIVKEGITETVGLASDLGETVNKSGAIFGTQAGAMSKWSQNAATTLGLARGEALATAAGFGDMFIQLGFADRAAARMSRSTIQMAADLGSFNNLETDDVLDRISGALRGEYDALQKVIPAINAARVQRVALSQTGKRSAADLTEQEKATAALAIIQTDGARAAGDFARTQSGYANASKAVGAQVTDLKTRIGQGLLPVFEAGANKLRLDLMPQLLQLADKYMPAVERGAVRLINSFDAGDISTFASGFEGIDWAAASSGAADLASAAADLGPALRDASGEAVGDSLSVFSVLVKFAADNVGLLGDALPYLAAGYVAVKVAQAGANVAAIASLPVKISEVVVNRQLVKSNVALIASRGALTTTTVAGTAAENVGTLSKIRGAAATIASATASRIAAGATLAWTGVQWVLNAALSANPIGLVVIAIAALVGGLILAYKKSETFRAIVDGALRFVAAGFTQLWNAARPVVSFLVRAAGVILRTWSDMLRILGSVPGFGWARKAADMLDKAAGKADDFARAINRIPSSKTVNVTYLEGRVIRGPIAKGNVAGARAAGGPTRAGSTYLVGENGPELWSDSRNGHITPTHELLRAARGHADSLGGGFSDADLVRAMAGMRFALELDGELFSARLRAIADERISTADHRGSQHQVGTGAA